LLAGLPAYYLRYGLHTRAVTVFRDTLSEGFRHFVSSMPAPVASGWSVCRVGLAPTGKRRLCTAHTQSGLFFSIAVWVDDADGEVVVRFGQLPAAVFFAVQGDLIREELFGDFSTVAGGG